MASTNVRRPIGRIAAILLLLIAGAASAQTQPPALDLRLRDLPDAQDEATRDATTPDEYAADTATSVHGSVTTGIGYSKNYGRSTFNAAELDVHKQYDSGQSLNLHIDVLQSTGLPNVAPRDYVSHYPGY